MQILSRRVSKKGDVRHRTSFTDFAFLKRMQKFNTTQVILVKQKGVYISRKEISSGLFLLLLESYNRKVIHEFDPKAYIFLFSQTVGRV